MKNLLTSKIVIILASIGAISGLGTMTVSQLLNDEAAGEGTVDEFHFSDLKEIVSDVGSIATKLKEKILSLLDEAKDDMGH